MTREQTFACPVCDSECRGREEFRFHLLTRHAKSDLVERLADDAAAEVTAVG